METLNCRSVRVNVWEYVAGTLAEEEHDAVSQHLSDCRECAAHRADVRSVQIGLKNLPAYQLPPLLEMRLKVIASRERARRVRRLDWAAWMRELREEFRLLFDNLLRPLAVPAAGGLLASCLCFGMIVDNLHIHPSLVNDIPVGLYSQVSIENLSPFSVGGNDNVMVLLNVDENGKVTDFTVPQGTATPDELNQIGNLVLYSTFIPARAFGQRVSSKVLVAIQHVNIHG